MSDDSTDRLDVGDLRAVLPRRLADESDDGLAEHVLERHGAEILYVPELSRFFVWDGRRFRADSRDGQRVEGLALAIAQDMAVQAILTDETRRLNRVQKLRRYPAIASAVKLLARKPEIHASIESLDADGLLLNCANGTVDLRTGELRPHDPKDRITRLCPVVYDPAAKAPIFEKNLARFQPDTEVREFLQVLAGSAAVGIPGKEIATIHYGGGANWKSTFIETLRDILGPDYTVELPHEALLAGRLDQAAERSFVRLPGARLATILEPEEGRKLKESALKRLVSNEPMNARQLYAEPFEFRPVSTFMMATNHRPVVGGTDHGIWRRIALVPWDETIPEDKKDVRFREWMIEAEGPGILRWIVEGAQRFQVGGLQLPEAVRASTNEYRTESDLVGAFLAERCSRGAGLAIGATTLHEAFSAFARENGGVPVSQRAFADRLKSHGIGKGTGRQRRQWVGVALEEDAS